MVKGPDLWPLEADGGIPCRPNAAATVLVDSVYITNPGNIIITFIIISKKNNEN